MPYTIKTQQIAVKDPDTGEYSGVDVLAEQTTEGLLNEIKAYGQTQKTEITTLGDTKKQAITDEATTKLSEITTFGDAKKQAITDEATTKLSEITTLGDTKKQAITDEATTKLSEITTLGDTKKQAITDEATTKLGEITQLGDGKKDVITQEATDQLTAITQLGNEKKQAVITEGTAQLELVESKGQEVLSSIPADYTDLVNTVDHAIYGGLIYDTFSGSEVNFEDGVDGMLFKSLVVNINSDTACSGVVVNRTGKNMLDPHFFLDRTSTGLTSEVQSDGSIHFYGTATSDNRYAQGSAFLLLPAGTYVITGSPNMATIRKGGVNITSNDGVFESDGVTKMHVVLRTANGKSYDIYEKIQIERGSTASEYEAYKGDRFSAEWPSAAGSVTNCSYDLIDGKLTVYNSGASNSYQLTPQQVPCFTGINTIWSEIGDVSVTYPVDSKTYIDRKIQEAIDGLSGS